MHVTLTPWPWTRLQNSAAPVSRVSVTAARQLPAGQIPAPMPAADSRRQVSTPFPPTATPGLFAPCGARACIRACGLGDIVCFHPVA